MSLVLATCCMLLGVAFATVLSRPATERSRRRAADRRAALVSADPARATTADVAAALRHEGIGEDQVAAVLRRARERGHTATTLWTWFETHGLQELRPADRAVSPPPARVAPAVFEPGTYPGLEVPTRRRVHLRDNVRRDGGGDAAA